MPTVTRALRRAEEFANLGVDYSTLKSKGQDVALGQSPAGLYVVQPNYCVRLADQTVEDTPHRYIDCYRCGSVGTKEHADEATSIDAPYNAKSSLSGRMQMYHSNWLGGGKILAFLKLSKDFVYNAQFLRVEQKYIDEFGKVGGRVKTRERQFHRMLTDARKAPNVHKVRDAANSEWFAGPRDEILQALLRVCGKHHENRLFLFDAERGRTSLSQSSLKPYLQVTDEQFYEVPVPLPDRTLRALPGRRKADRTEERVHYGA